MGKKMDRGEPKKECPSCGLGVSLEANICEFCGWDFEEEDEWILQIEKLERDLLLEKQKFEPGTVNHKIESTLRSPLLERAEAAQVAARAAPEPEERAQPKVAHTAEDLIHREVPQVRRQPEPPIQRHVPAPTHQPAPAKVVPEEPAAAKTRKVRSVKAPVAEPAPTPRPEPKPVPRSPEASRGPGPAGEGGQARRGEACTARTGGAGDQEGQDRPEGQGLRGLSAPPAVLSTESMITSSRGRTHAHQVARSRMF